MASTEIQISRASLLSLSLLLCALLCSTGGAEGKMASDYLAERMLDVTDHMGLANFGSSLERCYDLLDEMRAECNQNCYQTQGGSNACFRSCWGGWKYGRLTCRLKF